MEGPSKKVPIFFVVVVLIVTGVITFSSISEKFKASQGDSAPEEVTLSIGRESARDLTDTDEDGLYDWEEDLWGSDKKNSDTDGDGTNDGDEIAQRRDPTVAGPNDSLEETRKDLFPENKIYYDNIVPGSLTDNLSINLAANYLNYKQGGQFSAENQDQLVSSIVSDVGEIAGPVDKYETTDLLLMINTITNYKDYGDRIGGILQNNFNYMSSIQVVSEEEYTKTMSTAYKNLSERLAGEKVPSALSKPHAEIINNLYNIAVSLDELVSYKEDPVRALIAIKKYQQIAQDQPLVLQSIKKFFDDNGIIFTSSEPGNLWNKI